MSGLAALISATLAAMSVKPADCPAHRQVLPGILCVRGWGSKRCHFIVFVRRLPNRMANGLAACFQITGGIFRLHRKERNHLFPLPSPHLCDDWEFATPFALLKMF